ncbi:MAG: hypothetical protein QM504_00760 [Pseudomonadota bacterium]
MSNPLPNSLQQKKPMIIGGLTALSVLLFIFIYITPLWWVALTAPNYPETAFPDGVRINFHMNGVFNGCTKIDSDEVQESEALDCVHEMDTINHYVGMYPIAAGGPIERGFSPFLITMLVIMVIAFAIGDPKKRTIFLTITLLLNSLWMANTIFKENGLNTQNEGYLYALMNQLDQDANDKSLGDEEVKAVNSTRALAQLKASLAGKEYIEEKMSEQQSDVAQVKTEISDKQHLLKELQISFEVDMANRNIDEKWVGNGYQLMSWHYAKVLGRYFNNPAEIDPMVKTLKLATLVVFWGLIIAAILLIWQTRVNKGIFYYILIFVPMALPVFFIIDYAAWLWWYGHTLNDMGAFAVKPFMPTVFGVGKVAQFSTFSYPSIGFGFMVLNSAILAAIVLLKRK